MERGNSESLTLGGPSLSPSARTLLTGVTRVTESTPISAKTKANSSAATKVMYFMMLIVLLRITSFDK
jgi:hypothetical protein